VKRGGWIIVIIASGASLVGPPVRVDAADAFGPTFQCTQAAAAYKAAADAAAAGQDTQVVTLAQHAIDAYGKCKNKSTDDTIQQVAAVMMAAAFLPKDSKQRALYLYDEARSTLAVQCTAYPSLDLWAKAQIIGAAEQYRTLAVALGAAPVESCDQRWPPPAPSPTPHASPLLVHQLADQVRHLESARERAFF
jgi:hypothetical protein